MQENKLYLAGDVYNNFFTAQVICKTRGLTRAPVATWLQPFRFKPTENFTNEWMKFINVKREVGTSIIHFIYVT